MGKYKVLPLLVLFLLLSAGQSQIVEQANAVCCGPPYCKWWGTLIFGPIEMVGNGKAKISTVNAAKQGLYMTVNVDPHVIVMFQMGAEGGTPITKDVGFIVLEGDSPSNLTVMAFVTADRQTHGTNDEKVMPAPEALNYYQKAFEDELGKSGKR